MKKAIIFFSFFVFACKPSKYVVESRELLKEYAFCKCVQYASNDSTLFRKDVSTGVYRDISHYDFDTYHNIDSISKIAASHILPSIIADHEGKKAVFLDCFNYYKNRFLDSLIKTMDKEILKDW